MNLLSQKTIKELLLQHGAKPSKFLGQNFLVDSRPLMAIVDAAQLTKKDTVLEIGPGIGTLTQELAKRVKKVVAVEKDRLMEGILQNTLRDYKNIEVIQGDILKLLDHGLPIKNYKVVANIPYYLTSVLIRKLLEAKIPPTQIFLMVQKEVAQRICAKPPRMSLLAVSVQFYAEAKIVSFVSKHSFWPSPKVDSAIISIIPHNKKVDAKFRALFFAVVKAGFSHPRKQLVNNLATLKSANGVTLDKYMVAKWLQKNHLKENQRAETLSLKDWETLAYSFKSFF